ncbi:hypothetical protein GCM10023189_41180 [Nibrella saemangeumensis]|uniref:NADH-quinone oxidoreductase subunit E n=1 Tax=Nibrella saemangeumensis TaxID=1084526 RepID=A0ABP8NBZ1_9BACT
MIDFNPFNNPDALWQHAIMLSVSAIIGFIIGYISRQKLINQLTGELAGTERELEDCQNMPAPPVSFHTGDDPILNRILARRKELNFERIGRATPPDADNLKEIVGIGPFTERKLNALGIFTFHQIARFTREDIDKVNDIIEFFPGRIERDNWVGQALELISRKR